jgi:hypothetical protein
MKLKGMGFSEAITELQQLANAPQTRIEHGQSIEEQTRNNILENKPYKGSYQKFYQCHLEGIVAKRRQASTR